MLCLVEKRFLFMGQLLLMLIVPPIVGVATYAVIRIVFNKDEDKDGETIRKN
jgi:hypothetical protein